MLALKKTIQVTLLSFVLALIFLLAEQAFAIPRNVRNEVHRYTLLRDRVITERSLRGLNRQEYMNLELHISSGTKKLIGDIRAASDDSTLNSTQQQAEINNILNQNLNTERYADADLALAFPLPEFNLKKMTFFPTVFGILNVSGSLSISNANNGSNPTTQMYIKQDQKLGVNAYIEFKKPLFMNFSLYQLKRKDLFQSKTAAQIESENKFFDQSGLGKTQTTIRADYTVGYKHKHLDWFLKIEEFKLLKDKFKPTYGDYFMIDLRATAKINRNGFFIRPSVGIHRRSRYSLIKGVYLAGVIRKDPFPLNGMFMLDPEMLTLALRFENKYVHASYSVKLPHQNPVDNVWVPKIHVFQVKIPFW